MVSRLVKTEFDRKLLVRYITGQKLPFTCEISRKRTLAQNNLQHRWMAQSAQQLDGHTVEELRGYCKLHFGVPILRDENKEFREVYDRIIKPLPYEHKIACMMEPFDFAVTRLMKTKQKTAYLDAVYRHFSEMGVMLSLTEDAPPREQAA